MEIELKLLLEPADADALRRHPMLAQYAAAPAREQQLSDTYYDTPAQDFRQGGAGLRVRRVGTEWIQTLKGGGDAGAGLHRRQEWESAVVGPEPDLAALRKLVGRKDACGDLLRAPGTAARLAPVFRTEVTRTVWDLVLPGGDTVELALDQGKLEAGGATAAVSEIELELKSGDAVRLFDFALALQQQVHLRVASSSKAERGYALGQALPHQPVKASPVKLSRKDSVEKAFRTIAANCVAQIHANSAGVADAYDEESLHQMRVGLRRLRSARGVFGKVLQLPPALSAELDWLAYELGHARDWDVMAGSTLPSIEDGMPPCRMLSDVIHAARETGQGARAAATDAARSQRYTRLMLSLGRWLYGKGWRQQVPARARLDVPARRVAATVLRRADNKLRKRGKALAGGTPEARHRTRIAAKKMRYASEFFASLYSGKQVKSFVKALTGLQDELGLLNDAVVAETLLAKVEDAHPGLAGPLAMVRTALRQRADDTTQAQKAWKRFAKARLPR
ncbi:CYTH and CHAD domain-containing protein [Massilia cavernae]|nr:CYTH and CHAD domain-containing protein [Massilia cavernae]